jgi:hypothetical protein
MFIKKLPISVQELITRFPEIPHDLYHEPILAKIARNLQDLLRVARKPSACTTEHDASHHFYLKIIGPMAIYGYGLAKREKVLNQLQELLERYHADPDRFAASLLPPHLSRVEIKGSGIF